MARDEPAHDEPAHDEPAHDEPAYDRPAYTVGEVASIAHVSVRALHHYDEIGLLSPGGRSAAGYRLYGEADVERLRQILVYRALEFALDDIAALLDDPAVDVDGHLRRQHALLRERIGHQQGLLAALEKEMEARNMGISLTPEERFEIFGPDAEKYLGGEYAAEAEQRWGETQQWQQSRRRTAAYTAEDWWRIRAEQDANTAAFADALRAGEPADSASAVTAAEEHRAHISRWFYDCDHTMHRALAGMYVSDPRFTRTYDAVEPGLAQYVHDAIEAGATAQDG